MLGIPAELILLPTNKPQPAIWATVPSNITEAKPFLETCFYYSYILVLLIIKLQQVSTQTQLSMRGCEKISSHV